MAWAKVLLVVFALGTTWGSVASTGAQQIKTTSTKNRTFTLPSNCPTSCGNISIQYPFGIGDGCYLPGFNLTCRKQNNRTVSAQLFMGDGTLEVTGITLYSGYVSFKLPVISMGVSQSSITTPLIDLKNYHNFNFWATDNYLFVSGCNVNASVVDLANNNTIIYNCSTFCLDVSPDLSPFVIRHQKCRVRIGNELPDRVFLGVRLTRFNQTRLHLTNATPVSAYMSSSIGSLESKLSWYMDDHSSCTEAMNDTGTYACISSNGECTDALSVDRDVTVGYYCRCSGGTEGNPYLTDGCKDVTVANIYPANNCTRKCGSVDIPFPFGLDNESDCYRDSLFALVCNQTTSPPVLQYQDKNVSKVGVERGELYLMEVRNSSEGLTLTEGHYVYSWLIPHHSCENARMNKSLFACVSEHVECRNLKDSKGDQLGYRCGCEKGYTGNPYIMNGCQDINECDTPEKYICKGICKNTEGSYNCTCQPGTYGDPMIGGCIPYTKKRTVMLALIIAAGNVCLLLLCAMLVILSKIWKKRMQKQIKEKNFHQNHGLLLQQLISTSEHDAERTKLFPLEEIEKATNNFDETRMLGRGGHGVVYKGILTDQRVVAIKKSTNLKKSEIDQFINEVAILSQINHRHIVKLFGCCLETEIPLLIYEFISNGTLSHHLHVPSGQSKLSWDDRLRIATEVACSLAYLHSDVSMSIFHRDVKSSNILLDDNLVAKVSDFGASRFIPLDQNYVVTAVQGTFGYLDPEYYQTSELTEKSDVYSFGVILLELLTGKAPIHKNEHGDEVNLSKQFLQAMRENHALDLVEDHVLKEGKKEELLEIIQMIEMCLRLKGEERPTMKEVEYKLQGLRRIRMMKKRLSSFAEDNETTENNLSDAFDPSTELVDQRNQGIKRQSGVRSSRQHGVPGKGLLYATLLCFARGIL
ncbi:wall-associated receptor kinase-like 6 isoform X2 [Zingiber officinale]|uniref:wall-associated receptor kinase-like 6 isoform X2 n=1 Tax=Zingiber officinale TaxID=94328 RepID=UPI001C4D8A60|nr:wall-associated receptor kinase-like 6 isoform X2 [Zingiber officinale]